MDINKLYKQACNNDSNAENQLFQILGESFGLFIQKRVWNKQDSEGIVQEAMLVIAQKYKTAEIKSDFVAWAYTILKYKLLDYIKRRGLRINTFKPAIPDMPRDLSYHPDPAFKLRLLGCLKKICRKNIRFARILNLNYQGFSIEDICARMNLTKSAFYVLLSRARNMMKTCINSENDRILK